MDDPLTADLTDLTFTAYPNRNPHGISRIELEPIDHVVDARVGAEVRLRITRVVREVDV